MRRNYTTGFVVITAALLILACILFAVTQGGPYPAGHGAQGARTGTSARLALPTGL